MQKQTQKEKTLSGKVQAKAFVSFVQFIVLIIIIAIN